MGTITRADIVTALAARGLPSRLVTLGGGVLGVEACGSDAHDGQAVIVTLDLGADDTVSGVGSAEIAANYPPDMERPDDCHQRDITAHTADGIAAVTEQCARELGLVGTDDDWSRCDVYGHESGPDGRCDACGAPMPPAVVTTDEACTECGQWLHNHADACSRRVTCDECGAPDGWHWVRCSRREA